MKYGERIGEKEYGKAAYWADGIAEHLVQRYPKQKTFVCASGISPSGNIHFGNFREVITAFAVVQALRNRGKETRYIYTWDNFDRFRKVPAGIDPSYEKYIGKALSDIPSPTGKGRTYAEGFQDEFEEALRECGIKVSAYQDQTRIYKSGAYDKYIIEALRKRKEIAGIMLSSMTEKAKKGKNIIEEEYRESYYPITIYSRFTGKDATKILKYDGKATVRYRCGITKKEEEVDLTKTRIAKLNWKVDWAMRWKHEGVHFEPAGSDHAAPGGSYEVSAAIAKKIFNVDAPVFTEYGFVGLQGLGTKMSGSTGKNITPGELLRIYEPTLLLWMYLRRLPTQTFSLAFDTEVYRQYDEMDRAFKSARQGILARLLAKPTDEITETEKRVVAVLRELYPNIIYKKPIPFRQITGLAQIARWDEEKLRELLKATRESFDRVSVHERIGRAKVWVTKYNRDAMIELREKPSIEAWRDIDERNRGYIQKLREYIRQNNGDSKQTEEYLYSLPKEHYTEKKDLKRAQRQLFKHIYGLLIGKDSGPRLGTFLSATPKDTVLPLLNPEETDEHANRKKSS